MPPKNIIFYLYRTALCPYLPVLGFSLLVYIGFHDAVTLRNKFNILQNQYLQHLNHYKYYFQSLHISSYSKLIKIKLI